MVGAIRNQNCEMNFGGINDLENLQLRTSAYILVLAAI